ncbi:hypothetical protein COS75_01155, partial [Candidatus Pacearchaeota archaeon CG06_land_8_20_14_3_00_35_12]
MDSKMRRLNWIKVFIAMVLLAGAIYFCIYSINSLQSNLKNPITGEVISQGQDSGYGNLDSNSAVGKINLKDKDGEEVEAKINYLNGKKDIEIIPQESSIKKIVVHGINLGSGEGYDYGKNAIPELKLDDVPEEKEREKRAKEMKEKEEAKLRAEEEAKKAK